MVLYPAYHILVLLQYYDYMYPVYRVLLLDRLRFLLRPHRADAYIIGKV